VSAADRRLLAPSLVGLSSTRGNLFNCRLAIPRARRTAGCARNQPGMYVWLPSDQIPANWSI